MTRPAHQIGAALALATALLADTAGAQQQAPILIGPLEPASPTPPPADNPPPPPEAPPSLAPGLAPPSLVPVGPSSTPATPQLDVETTTETVPNYTAIAAGALGFAGAYGTAAVVGGVSNHPGDGRLFIPLAGPWWDLASRPGCGGPCSGSETANRVLLVADGIAQDLGALVLVGGFLFPRQRTVVRVARLRVRPTFGGGDGYGLKASGVF